MKKLKKIFATVISVATSLGSVAIQINGGLNGLFNIPGNYGIQLIIIIIATVLFMASALSGLDKGMNTVSTSQISSQFARYKSDRFAILQIPGLNPAPAKSFSHHLKVVGYLFDLYIDHGCSCQGSDISSRMRRQGYPDQDNIFRGMKEVCKGYCAYPLHYYS